MNTKEKLLQEFECAIGATLGSLEEKDYEEGLITVEDITEIARKVIWYLDLR